MKRPLRIGLVMQGGAGWIGGSEYIRNLILVCSHLPAAERADFELCLISGHPLDSGFTRNGLDHLYELSTALPPATLPNRVCWLVERRLLDRPNSRFAKFVAAERFDFLYPLTYDNRQTVQVSLPIRDALGTCRWAGWIPDFQHRFMPELFSAKEIANRDAGIGALADDAKTIVFSSESAAADFAKFYPRSAAKIEVLRFHTYPDSSWFEGDPLAVRRQFHLPERFFIVSNQFWQHKNHAVLFQALALLRARGIEPAVVCTGHPNDFRSKDYFNTLLRLLHELGIAPQVHLLGLIARKEQIQLMRAALAVVQPSLFEGWSTVVEDARALGKPVIYSDLPVHLEQNPPGSVSFQRDSPESLAARLAEWWETSATVIDVAAETAARARAAEAALGYARRFLEIVRTAA